jgi:hypothetical protein
MPTKTHRRRGRVSKDEQSAGTTLPRGGIANGRHAYHPAQCLARAADCSLADRACGGERVRGVAPKKPHYDGVNNNGAEPAVISICSIGPIVFHNTEPGTPGWRKL